MYKIQYCDNLKGQIKISWAKNAALPILAANYIVDQKVELENVPEISDIALMKEIYEKSKISSTKYFDLTSDLCEKMRSSILLIAPGLLKSWEVKFVAPGGCKIGKRSLDAFDNAFISCGVDVEYEDFKTYKITKKPLKKIILDQFSVTTTEAILTYLAFCDADFEIEVFHIAIEPHVINLINFLNNIWADIKISYDHSCKILPQKPKIKKDRFSIIWDSIVAWTYLALWAVAKNSDITLTGFDSKELYSYLNIFAHIWIDFDLLDDWVKVSSKNLENYRWYKLQTQIFPWFPTDLQSIMWTIFTQCDWISRVFETMYEWRFSYLSELENLWAKTEILNPHQAIIIWKTPLKWNFVASKDLRCGWAVLVAWAIAEWTTYITNEEIISRGYPNVIQDLQSIWVSIEYVEKV